MMEQISANEFPAARRALLASFILISVVGCAGLMVFWRYQEKPSVGLSRSIAFLLCMAALHTLGYRTFCEQTSPTGFARGLGLRLRALADDFVVALIFLLASVILGSISLDFGALLRLTLLAAAGHWAGNLAILIGRFPLGRGDHQFVRYGHLISMGMALLVGLALGSTWG